MLKQFFFYLGILMAADSVHANSPVSGSCNGLLDYLSTTFLEAHRPKENAAWARRMKTRDYVEGAFEEGSKKMTAFNARTDLPELVRAALEKGGWEDSVRVALQLWKKYFEVNSISDPIIRQAEAELTALADRNERDKEARFSVGYIDPATKQFVKASTNSLRPIMDTNPNRNLRKAAFDGMRQIELDVLASGWIDLVKARNKFARSLPQKYEDFYDYSVQQREGISKRELFKILDDFELQTRAAQKNLVDSLVAEFGPEVLDPWNLGYLVAGNAKTERDPYFQMKDSISHWGRAMSAMHLDYRNATLTLDLLDRPGKWENGFCQSACPSYRREDESRVSAEVAFTSNGVPGQLGSGETMMATLLHEGGHGFHFANNDVKANAASQEYAPTSPVMAEVQSMFIDSLQFEPIFMKRYAINDAGDSVPDRLIEETALRNHRFQSMTTRTLLQVPYFEKAIYEMSDAELTPANILRVAREVEKRILMLNGSARPLLAVPHLRDNDASAYYHSYMMAEMGVSQTHAFAKAELGYVVDNPKMGPLLTDRYWKDGNTLRFVDFIKQMTGKDFSAAALIAEINRSPEQVLAEIRAELKLEKEIPRFTGPVNLNATIRLMHGDEVIATNEGQSFEAMAEQFKKKVVQMEADRAAQPK